MLQVFQFPKLSEFILKSGVSDEGPFLVILFFLSRVQMLGYFMKIVLASVGEVDIGVFFVYLTRLSFIIARDVACRGGFLLFFFIFLVLEPGRRLCLLEEEAMLVVSLFDLMVEGL